jgi:2'-5' RNA ligase
LDQEAPLIVTLKLDAVSFDRLNELRRMHFPPERNFLSAHITLFHALPGKELPTIRSHLQQISALTRSMEIAFPRVQSLGRGVAIEVMSEDLKILHQRLAACFSPWLTPQDRQRFRPHVTIQNKVSAERARELYDLLAPQWKMPAGHAAGLSLWAYKGGPWLGIEDFSFAGA